MSDALERELAATKAALDASGHRAIRVLGLEAELRAVREELEYYQGLLKRFWLLAGGHPRNHLLEIVRCLEADEIPAGPAAEEMVKLLKQMSKDIDHLVPYRDFSESGDETVY